MRVQELRASGLLRSFLNMHTAPQHSRFPEIYQNYTDPITDVSFLSFSFQAFCLACCFSQLLFTATGRQDAQQLPLIVFNEYPDGEKAVCTG